MTLFDLIKDDPDNISVDYDGLRTGRCGTALLVSGTYMMVVGLGILIPDTSDKRKVSESYDGNIWNYYQWKRSNMVFCSITIIFFCLFIIQFSFSDVFGDWIWTFIGILKGSGIIFDWALEKAMDESLLVSPLSITQSVMLGLVTFGADDFLDFI